MLLRFGKSECLLPNMRCNLYSLWLGLDQIRYPPDQKKAVTAWTATRSSNSKSNPDVAAKHCFTLVN
jgi:hypothetical protein